MAVKTYTTIPEIEGRIRDLQSEEDQVRSSMQGCEGFEAYGYSSRINDILRQRRELEKALERLQKHAK